MEQRRENLRLLAIFHFVYAGLVLLGTLLPMFWFAMASVWWPELASELETARPVPWQLTGTLGLALVATGVTIAWIWAGVLVVAGRSLMSARRHVFCQVTAAVACLSVPLGTALGVTTLVVLHQAGTRALFEAPDATPGA